MHLSPTTTGYLLFHVYYVIQLAAQVIAKNSTHSLQLVQIQTKPERPTGDKIQQLQNKYQLDLISVQSAPTTVWDFLAKADVTSRLAQDLTLFGIPHKIISPDDKEDNYSHFVDDLMRTRKVRRKRWTRGNPHDRLRYRFLKYDEMEDALKSIQAASRSRFGVKVVLGSIGQSFEGRETPYITISNTTTTTTPHGRGAKTKPVVFLDSGIHGREWISPAMAMEIIHQLSLNPDRDPEVDDLLSWFDWVIVPVVNPDGYVYTFGETIDNRLWRKSRTTRYSDNPQCYGVDLNRNFGFEWNNDPLFGGSSDPCSAIYSGPNSFSEPETRNLRDLLLAHRSSISAYFSLHSFGQFVLYPWAFSSLVDLDDENDLHHVASAFVHTMKKKHYNYHIGGTAKVLYPAAGGSDDYVRGSLGVKYAYTIELPPHEASRYGFLLPEHEVKTVVRDTWAGLKAVMARLHDRLVAEAEINLTVDAR